MPDCAQVFGRSTRRGADPECPSQGSSCSPNLTRADASSSATVDRRIFQLAMASD